MTDEQIIKALECCATDDGNDCFQCPYCNIFFESGNGGCVNRCRKDALDLINRQKAEIERLKRGVTFTFTIEDFESIKETVISRLDNEIKSEAIKEFAERLCKGRVENDPVVIATKAELDYVLGVGLEAQG